MSSRDPNDLHPALQALWAQLVPAAAAQGYTIFLTCTHRSNAEQAQLYALGDRRTGKGVVTNARPGQSAHNVEPPEGSHALDFGVMVNGAYERVDTRPYLAVATLAHRLGADCGAFWNGFKDYPHIQMPGWRPGRVYGPAFRFVPARTTPVVPKPTPATPSPLRPVVLRNAADTGWEAMKVASTTYGTQRITRLPGGDLVIGGLLVTVNSDGDVFIKRTGGTP